MLLIKLQSHHLETIRTHAESTYPNECCGLLIGQLIPDKTVVEVLPTENAWNADSAEAFQAVEESVSWSDSKRDRYVIAPEVMFKAQKEAREHQLEIIGIYHSHPDHSAVPSEVDRVWAWPVYSYIIVSVQQGKACELNSWSLDDNHHFQREEISTDAALIS